MGFPQKNIYYPPSKRIMAQTGKQYFDVFEPRGTENFIDAGCFDGQTTLNFIEWCKGHYEKVWVFEAGHNRINICQTALTKAGVKYDFFAGVCYSQKCNVRFSANYALESFGAGRIIQSHSGIDSTAIPATTIDEFTANSQQKPTFIKMDIEGSELDALIGAKETIKKHRPRLAISIYHKLDDIIHIPSYIVSLVPDYRFYIRHYSSDIEETVLYAE